MGVFPEEIEIYSRYGRNLEAPDIFLAGKAMGKEMAYMIGCIQIINVSIDPIFNLDFNKSGSTDDEILEMAVFYPKKGLDLLVVHFKDIDRAGHNYGDLHPVTIETIAKLDGY